MNRRIFIIALMLLILLASGATAGQKPFEMPKDMKFLLPVSADAVLAVSSLEELDELWQELLPDIPDRQHASLSHYLQTISPLFVQYVDRDQPFLAVINALSLTGNPAYYVTGLMALKDKNFEVASVPGLDEFTLVREGRYLAVSTDPDFSPATQHPFWASELNDGLVSASLDMASLIEANRALLEMVLPHVAAQAGNSTQDFSAVETSRSLVKLGRSFLNSAEGLDFFLTQDGNLVAKDFIFRTKPGSELSPAASQPSFSEALNLTRILPGGESLLTVSALDQSSPLQIFIDYFLMIPHSTMNISSAPSAMTMRFEKNNSSFQSIIKSDDAKNDWKKLLDLANGRHGLGMEFKMTAVETAPFEGHHVDAWQLERNEDELVTMLRFLPGNIYLAQMDDYLLFCGGPSQNLMNNLIHRIDAGKGQIDPRLKKLNNSGRVQCASVGDLNAVMGVILELMEEMAADDELPWISDHPLPFLQTLEIDRDEYQLHVEMEKPVVRQLIKSALDLEQE